MKMILARSAGLLDLISAESLFNLFKHRSPSRRKQRSGTASLNLGANCVQIERLEEKVVLSASFGSAITVNDVAAPGNHVGEAVTTDGDGNVYITGQFSYSADFDPTHVNTSAILTGGSNDAFVAKYSADGTFAWVTAFRNNTPNSGGVSGQDIAVVNGNVYVTGEYFTNSPTFGSTTITLSAAGYSDGYVTMLDAAAGGVQWAKRIGGDFRDADSAAIAVDATGNAYVTYTLGVIEANVNANWDVRVEKFNSAGDSQWSKQVGGSSIDECGGIAVDGLGNVVVTGNFRDSGDFDPGTGIYKLSTGLGSVAAFVLKLKQTDGSFVWADAFSSSGRFGGGSHAFDVAIDSVNNIYVTGNFGGSVDFDPGKGKLTLPNAGGSDAFVVKLSAAGSLLWGRSMGGTNNDAYVAGGLAVDRAKNVYVTGVFGLGAGNFDTATFGSTTLTSAGDMDIFVTKLDTNGVFKWAVGAGGTGLDIPKGIAVYTPTTPSSKTNIYTTGSFDSTADFDPATDGYFGLTGSSQSLFLWKLLDDEFI